MTLFSPFPPTAQMKKEGEASSFIWTSPRSHTKFSSSLVLPKGRSISVYTPAPDFFSFVEAMGKILMVCKAKHDPFYFFFF